jgi:hypothetical protein
MNVYFLCNHAVKKKSCAESQKSKFIIEPTEIKVAKRVMPLMVGSLPPCEFLWTLRSRQVIGYLGRCEGAELLQR